MSPSLILGLIFALATALASIVGFLYKQRGAVEAPAVAWRHPLRTTLSLFSNRWWTIGLIVATASWGLHVTALALAPITLVQTVIAGGLVLLTVIADRAFGLSVTQREWIGVGLTAVGLAFLAATLGNEGSSPHNHYETATLAIYVGALAAVSFVLCVTVARERWGGGLALATAAGLQWGASDVTIKALSGHLHHDGVLVLLSPLAAVILSLSLIGLVVSARSLQLGGAVAVIAVTSAAANLVTIASGLVVFGEPLPAGTGAAAVRLLAFALVIAAAAMTPAAAPRAP
jgi:drug/metabolite transporter (DMT)-like permease